MFNIAVNVDPLIDSSSDAGGVASRVGFRFQDHVGASILLEMLSDSSILSVEFETADDIVVRKSEQNKSVIEYIQVKTTEADSKWTLKEVTERETRRGKKAEGTSLCEKSLACDNHPGEAHFCFVTSRDVSKKLRPFLVPRQHRLTVQSCIDDLAASIGRKYKRATSPNGRTLQDWAKTLHWRVGVSSEVQQSKSTNSILRLCEARGLAPTASRADSIYESLLKKVRDSADASRARDPYEKSISRTELLEWWDEQRKTVLEDSHVTAKVYEYTPECFLEEISSYANDATLRYMNSYDAQYDDGTWRADELCEYLVEWLPEMALPSHVLSNFNRFNARDLLRRAVRELKGKSISSESLLSETLLHAIMRNHLNSEPIPCRIFSLDDGAATSAHVVFCEDGDQLWLGRPAILSIEKEEEILGNLFTELETAVSSGILKKEKELALTLREPAHVRPTSLEGLLSKRAKIEDLRRVVHLPILLAFDSEHLRKGYYDEYLQDLISEVDSKYKSWNELVPGALSSVSVSFFLIPVPDVTDLSERFSKAIER